METRPTCKTTVITMFFNLKKLKDQSAETRPAEFYVKNGQATMALPYPMIIFCDEETYELTRSLREQALGKTIPTEYIIKNITEYEYYQQNWDIIVANRQRSDGYKDPNNRNTPSYCLLTMFKFMALQLSHQRNPFQSEFFAWIDFGCNHVVRGVAEYAPKMIENPNPKVSICYIHYRGHQELSDMRAYMEHGGPCGLACTAFTVDATYVSKLYSAMFAIFNEMLFAGYGHSEETAIAYCYDRYPELFTIYNGDYYSVMTNYHKPREDLWAIKYYFINQAMNKGRMDLAKSAALRIVDAIEDRATYPDGRLLGELEQVLRA